MPTAKAKRNTTCSDAGIGCVLHTHSLVQTVASRVFAPSGGVRLEGCELAKAFGLSHRWHGLYAWGRDLAEARRHLEAFEFLLACELELRG